MTPIDEKQGWTKDGSSGINQWNNLRTMKMGNGQTYDKFLVIHPKNNDNAYQTYDLNGEYTLFTAIAGPSGSSVTSCLERDDYGTFSIYIWIDDILKYSRERYFGKNDYDQINIDVTNAQQIKIWTDNYGDNANCDHATIADPLLHCPGIYSNY